MNEAPARIRVSKKVKVLDPVARAMARNLAEIDQIRFIRILPDLLEASSEATAGRNRIPIITPGHASAIGVSVIFSFDLQEVQFFAITSKKKGYGGRMVDAVIRALPVDWKAIVVMEWDWSEGFWKHISEKYANLDIV